MLEHSLLNHFGHTSFRSGQKETITSLLEGRDTLAMLPTGTGKSLCFQLPGYLMGGAVLIVSPLLSLMQDQVEQLMKRGEKRVIALNSFLPPEEKRRALESLHLYKFIYISPEMLGSGPIIHRLGKVNISLLAIDEAHCISQWGYDFRPDYLRIGEFRESLGNPLTLALTATATPEVRDDIVDKLGIPSAVRIELGIDRPNIAFHVERMGSAPEKSERALQLARRLAKPGILYFSSKKSAEQMAGFFRENGLGRTMAYHGGLDQEQRILIQQQFLNGQLDIICATSAFGMGVDKENIRFVIHFHMPMQIESYLQEIGRAGRDGQPSIAILLFAEGDEQLQYYLAEGELPAEEQLNRLVTIEGRGNTHEEGALLDNSLNEAGFTETQARWLIAFLKSESRGSFTSSIEKAKQYIRKRNVDKAVKIRMMKGLIEDPGCKRSYLLRYFGEAEPEKSNLSCCSSCGLSLDGYIEDNEGQRSGQHKKKWKELLSDILIGGVK